MASLFMDLLDLTLVNVALPAIGADLDASTPALQWAVTGHAVASAIVMPASGWSRSRFGARRAFLFAVTVFTVGSALGAVAWDLPPLVASRALRGFTGGLLSISRQVGVASGIGVGALFLTSGTITDHQHAPVAAGLLATLAAVAGVVGARPRREVSSTAAASSARVATTTAWRRP